MRTTFRNILDWLRYASQRSALLVLLVYRYALSPILNLVSASGCRFEPSCSRYASEAIRRYGLLSGARLAMVRLLQCRPGGGWGFDPVPPSCTASTSKVAGQ